VMRIRLTVLGAVMLAAAARLAWTPGIPLPERIQEHHAAVYRGRIYVAGGLDSTGQTTAVVYRFDPNTSAWTRLSDLPGPRHHMPLVVVADTLYAFGGFSDRRFTPESTVWAYDERTDTWTSRAPLPAARGASAAGVVDGKVVIVGGYGLGRALLDTTLIFDPRRGAWSNGAPIPTRRDHLEAQVVNGVLYAIGGRPVSLNNYDVVEAYDLATNSWSAKAPMPSKRGGLASALLDGRIHTFGGEGNTASPNGVFDNHESYDPATNRWTVEQPMPTPRHGLAAVALGGRIYVIGGGPKQGLAQTAVVEVWR
jgi:N-acetylneuraminic acid mutarotase